MKKQTYYLPGYQKKSRTMTYVIIGIIIFIGVIFPFFAVNLRYQVGYIFSQIFDSIGMLCLTLGGIFTLFSILSVFVQRSLSPRYFIMGIVLLWIGCLCTGTVIEFFGFTVGNERSAGGGYHYFFSIFQ